MGKPVKMEVTRKEFEAILEIEDMANSKFENSWCSDEDEKKFNSYFIRIGRFTKKFLNAESEQKYKITKKTKMLADALEIANILESSLDDAYPKLKRKAIKFIRNYGK